MSGLDCEGLRAFGSEPCCLGGVGDLHNGSRSERVPRPVRFGSFQSELPDGRDAIPSQYHQCKVVRQSANDKAAVIGAGVTLFEALKAYDVLKAQGIEIRVIDAYSLQPVDVKTMTEAGRATGGAIITVEDHYASGGLGDAVSEAVALAGFTVKRLAVREIPRSGQPDELLDRYGISSRHIVDAVKQMVARA